MNQGFLKIMAVQELLREPCSGYTLVKHIQKHTGWKPSYGSIYPLLNSMQEQHLVTVKEDGRSKLYTITELGRRTFEEQHMKREQALQNIIEQLRILASLGDEEAGMIASLIAEKKVIGIPLKEIPEVPMMRMEVFRLIKEEKVQQHQKKLREIFGRAMLELKKL